MKWRNRNNAPLVSENTRLLFAEITPRSGKLRKIVPGWWYAEEGGGFYAPDNFIRFTHYMPYEEYWAAMESLEKQQR